MTAPPAAAAPPANGAVHQAPPELAVPSALDRADQAVAAIQRSLASGRQPSDTLSLLIEACGLAVDRTRQVNEVARHVEALKMALADQRQEQPA